MRVFQYGSNMSTNRLNHEDRLSGDAIVVEIARTIEPHKLAFTVWSKNNNCAAADIFPEENGRSIYGVVYDIPKYLISRETAQKVGRTSLDAIECAGSNYQRKQIALFGATGEEFTALTYVVRNRKPSLKTEQSYVQHILNGLKEHNMPAEYCQYVQEQIVLNNPGLRRYFKV